MRWRALLVLAAALVVVPAPSSLPAHRQRDKCRFYVAFYNDDRYVSGAPWDAECGHGSWHSPPWGNWGVDSNGGSRIDGDQFYGWKAKDGQHQWNSCKRDYPPPDDDNYNAANWTEEETTGSSEWYGNLIIDWPVGPQGCAGKDGRRFIVSDNWMELYELDPIDGDEMVGAMDIPDLEIQSLDCDHDGCFGNWSDSVEPSDVTGYYDDPFATIRMYVEAELIEVGGDLPDQAASFPVSDVGVAGHLLPAPPEVAGGGLLRSVIALARLGPQVAWLPSTMQASPEIEVTVLDAQTGFPLEGAKALWVEEVGGTLYVRNGRTDANGRAATSHSVPGARNLLVVAPG